MITHAGTPHRLEDVRRRSVRERWDELTPRGRRTAATVVVAFWLAALFLCARAMWKYESTAGDSGSHAQSWPSESQLPHVAGRATLVMFAHPKCPCTRASIEELSEVVRLAGDRVTATIVFVLPEGADASWEESDNRVASSRISGLNTRTDRTGREEALFGAETSGDVRLYDPNGHLTYAGGITAFRGHAGENVGRKQVLSCIVDGESTPHAFPVYGCPLSDPPPASQTRTPTLR